MLCERNMYNFMKRHADLPGRNEREVVFNIIAQTMYGAVNRFGRAGDGDRQMTKDELFFAG